MAFHLSTTGMSVNIQSYTLWPLEVLEKRFWASPFIVFKFQVSTLISLINILKSLNKYSQNPRNPRLGWKLTSAAE